MKDEIVSDGVALDDGAVVVAPAFGGVVVLVELPQAVATRPAASVTAAMARKFFTGEVPPMSQACSAARMRTVAMEAGWIGCRQDDKPSVVNAP
ncbi:MAG: hypothetical protein ACRDYY_02755 [Acidimicrobiales bacterium]